MGRQGCPFTISDNYALNSYYVTPGCAVYITSGTSTQPGLKGAFYDPCRLESSPCTQPASTRQPITLAHLLGSATSKLPFDPRAVGVRDALGTWPSSFPGNSDLGQASMDAQLKAAATLGDWRASDTEGNEIPWRLTPAFVEKIVVGGGSNAPGAAGNTRGAWSTAEGMGQNAGEFCDAISDWWPEDWTMPVGYHVTLPCSASQTGYRTFDAAFVVERPGNDDDTVAVTMRYVHTALRDPVEYHSTSGTAGFCRRGSYGMPRVVTNTMRVCTRDAVNVEYDATVPVKPRFKNGQQQFSDTEYCASTPYDVPWTIDSRDVAGQSMFSTGNVPMFRCVLNVHHVMPRLAAD